MSLQTFLDLIILYLIFAGFSNTQSYQPSTTERFLCPNCPTRTFKYKPSLDYHIRRECGRELRCEKCSKVFSQYSQLLQHNKYGCSSEFECVTCKRVYNSVRAVRTHAAMNTACAKPDVCWQQIK